MKGDKIIIGQEAICPDGLGRVVSVDWFAGKIDRIKVDTYVANRGCSWAAHNVKLLKLPKFCSIQGKLPEIGWQGFYTKKGPLPKHQEKRRWFWCIIVGHDQGKVVVRTEAGRYHAHCLTEFMFEENPNETS